MPFNEHLGIELVEASEGQAVARLPFRDELRSHHFGSVAHGGATYALADTTGGAAVISLAGDVTPTVDMRIEYLSPSTTDLTATADVIRHGSNLSIAHVEVHDAEGTRVATAQGTYKASGQGDENPWGQATDQVD